MAESGQKPERSPKEPVRIVYHAQNRTFARLFKERTLDQVKDVVRHKLGLGPEVDVSLKQMGPDALLDLDDDDDFQAFRVLVKSSVTVDIQVTVGRSQGTSVSTHVAPQPQLSAVAPPVSLPSSSSIGQASPKTASVAGPSAATKKTPGPSARKRKVSFSDTPVATPAEPAEQRAQPKPVPATPASSAKATETPAATKSTQAEEPPKKKLKKDTAKAKDAQPTESVETPSTKASAARKPRAKKTAAPDRGTEAATSVPKGGESSELPAKKPVKRKKDAGPLPQTSSAPADPDGMDQPVSQPNAIHDTSAQPPSERRVRSGEKGGVSKIRQDEKKIGACAAIPRTSASMDVQSEVTAAILAGRIPTGPPPTPVKRKSVKRSTKKSLASSSASLSISTTANTSSSGAPNVSTEPGHEQAVEINKTPLQPREPNGLRCPICLGEPFHIRYLCPTVLKGAVAIRERLEEVKRSSAGDQQSLIEELEGLLRNKVASESPSNATLPHEVQSQGALQSPNASGSQTPNVPDNSNLSEVVVENRDEGSSSESSDDISEGRNKHSKELPAPLKRQNSDLPPTSPPSDVLEAVIRGPMLRRTSISRVLDRIEDEEEKDPESEVDEDGIELEEDREEEVERSSSQLSKRVASSSETEEEGEEESMPSSPSLAAQDDPGGSMQGSRGPVEKSNSMEHLGHDVVMENGVDPPVLQGQEDGSSEETHVGSEDHMEVDDTAGEKGVITIVEEQTLSPPSKAPFPVALDEPNDEPQQPGETEADLTADGDGRTPATLEVPREADPIEPADDLEPPITSRTSNSDPIEALPEDTETLFTGVTHSTPKPGVTKRIKTRDGRILDDEAELPVLLEELATSTVAPLPTKGKSRRKVTEVSASQEQESTRRRTRSNSLLPSTSTPATVTSASQEELIRRRSHALLPTPATSRLWDRKAKVGARSAKTPAKLSEQQIHGSQTSNKGDRARNAARIAPSPSLVNWETLAEPLSPSAPPDEPSVQMDELMSSSQPEDNAIVESLNAKNKNITPAQKKRLFDLSSSQIPFPYSQHKAKQTPTLVNGKTKEAAIESDSEQEARTTRKKARPSAYRTLSQLASQAVHFSPSLPTPSVARTKTRKLGADKYSSSSSSSSDEDEANKSTHIPQERRAGAKLETRKRKSILSRV